MKTPLSRQLRCGLLTLSIVGLVSVAASAQTPTPTPISNGKIAFTSGNGNPEIYIMDGDGLNWTRLTNTTAFESTPAWSPDGTKIAFTSDRDSSLDIYVMDANGANPVRLTTNPNTDENPAWSLDGAKIAFHSNRDGNYEIYVMDANGANQTRLTNHASSDESPAWSPDGTKIAFASTRDGFNAEVYVMDANGSNPVRLTNHPDVSDGPAWSPDGTKIIFHRGPTSNSDIWIMDSNGANAVLLVTTNSLSGDSLPAWSPDGTKIVFRGTPFGGGEISVADANGSNPMNLTINNVNETDPDWQRILGPGPTPTPSPTATPFPTPTPGACGWANSSLPLAIVDSAVASLGGNLYTFGGTTTNNVRLVNSYKFDGTTWTTIASLPVALTLASAVTDGTSLYVLGGYTITNVNVNTVYRYNPGSNTYTTLAPFAIASSAHAAAYLDGKIYKFCGYANSTPSPTSALEIYNIALNQWTAGANYPASGGLVSGGGFALGNFIYGVGGKTGGVPFQVDTALTCRYDPATNTWSDTAMADLPAPRERAATAAYNGGAVVAGGGSNGAPLASALFWDPTSDTWSTLPNMPRVHFGMNAAALGGSFYMVGGSSTAPPYTNDFQRLTCPLVPTPTATPTPSATPAAQALNLSTRMRVQTGDNVGIGGFIISGTGSKNVLVRAIGPSLTPFGVPNALSDPVLELHGPGGFATITNNNWRDDPAQEALIAGTGLAPSDNLESGIHASLTPGAYTAVVRGNNNATGVALIEVYDLNLAVPAKLANISTRAFVSTGNDIVIAGFILGNSTSNDRIVLRGIGPSLAQFGVPDALADPTLELRDNNGALLRGNNDWQDDSAQAAELTAAGLAPSNPLESGIAATLPPGAYTALLAGLNNGTGNGVVEVYDRGAP